MMLPTRTQTYRTHLGCAVTERVELNAQGSVETHVELSTLAVESEEQTRDRLNIGRNWPAAMRS